MGCLWLFEEIIRVRLFLLHYFQPRPGVPLSFACIRSANAALAAAMREMGTRNGEQLNPFSAISTATFSP